MEPKELDQKSLIENFIPNVISNFRTRTKAYVANMKADKYKQEHSNILLIFFLDSNFATVYLKSKSSNTWHKENFEQ